MASPFTALLLLVGCQTVVSTPLSLGQMAIPEAEDLSPEPNQLEVELTAQVSTQELTPGVPTTLWTYNGQLPGPTLRARRGDHVRVHFFNALDVPSTIHWHGIRLDNAMDGVPDLTQEPVPPGGHHHYDFTLPDAGTFWYHPHVTSSEQVGSGLYGAIVVEDPEEPTFAEEVLIALGDLSIDSNTGQLLPPQNGGEISDMFGREGQVVTTNGKRGPTLAVPNGRRLRMRILNASRARYFWLELPGHTFAVIGGDGGLQAAPKKEAKLLIAPGERIDALVAPRGEAGEHLELVSQPYDRFKGASFGRESVSVLSLELLGSPASQPAPVPTQLRAIEPIDTSNAATRTIVLSLNGNRFTIDRKLPPDMSVYAVAPNAAEVWTFDNLTEWDHPIHQHGFFFMPLDENQPLRWKDTINVPRRSQQRVAIRFDDRPGHWMLHCHILDHGDHGMMGMVTVGSPSPIASH